MPYVVLLGQSVTFYLSYRNYVYTPELFVPTVFAILPSYFIYSHFRELLVDRHLQPLSEADNRDDCRDADKDANHSEI